MTIFVLFSHLRLGLPSDLSSLRIFLTEVQYLLVYLFIYFSNVPPT